MNVSTEGEIAYARLNGDGVFIVTDLEKGNYRPLTITKPVGFYTMNPEALFAGKEYLFGLRLEHISLKGKLNLYKVGVSGGEIVEEPVYDAELDLILVKIKFDISTYPTLDETTLPSSLWVTSTLTISINEKTVNSDEDNNIVSLPISFDPCSATPAGEIFFNGTHAVMVIQPGENIILDLTSGSGGGAGVNLVKGENKSGGNGGDATLCYIEPDTGEIKPIVFVEGGLGGRLSAHTYQEFKPRTCKIKTFVNERINPHIAINVIELGHNLPSTDITSADGGIGHLVVGDEIKVKGGNGGLKDELGHRGEGGISGGRVIVQIIYNPFMGDSAGPFVLIHPKTMVNIFGVIKDKDLKIKKTKKPMLAGEGGSSLTQAGEAGQNGTLIVSSYNG